MLNSSFHRLAIIASAMALSACATSSRPMSAADTIASMPQLSTLSGLVNKAGLTETLKGPGPFTVFAPSNEAFAKVPAKSMEALSADPAKLKAVLTYHVLPVMVMSANVKNGNVKTVNGANLAVSKSGDFVTVEDAVVQRADIAATNGVIHTIDTVLMPPATR